MHYVGRPVGSRSALTTSAAVRRDIRQQVLIAQHLIRARDLRPTVVTQFADDATSFRPPKVATNDGDSVARSISNRTAPFFVPSLGLAADAILQFFAIPSSVSSASHV